MTTHEDRPCPSSAPDHFLLGLAHRLVEDYERAAAGVAEFPGDPIRLHELDIAAGALAIALASLGGMARAGDVVYQSEGGRLVVKRGVPDLAAQV